MTIISDFSNLIDQLSNTSGSPLGSAAISLPSSWVGNGTVNYLNNVSGNNGAVLSGGTAYNASVVGSSFDASLPTSYGGAQDCRLRLSYLSTSSMIYDGIVAPLDTTNGLMFPYTPTVTQSHDAEYETMSMTHSNTNYLAYSRTPNVNISITAKFSVQNQNEGLYALAAIHFLKTVTKMYFGETDALEGLAGTPPPMLELNGYGTYMFNKIHCILRRFSFAFDENMQMINIVGDNGYVRLPALFTVQLELTCQTTARAQRQDFNFEDFASGFLMEQTPNNNGWI